MDDLYNLLTHKDIKQIFDMYIFECKTCKNIAKVEKLMISIFDGYSTHESFFFSKFCLNCFDNGLILTIP